MAAVDAVEALDSSQPRLQTTAIQGGRRHLQEPDYLVLHSPLGGGGGGHGGGRYSDPNSYKKWNHWNACYSCGFDVPKWYTSATCPWECRKDHHQEGYTRDKYEEYVQAGWRPSKVGKHKKYLPLPGTELGK